jgi:hypothetical protein
MHCSWNVIIAIVNIAIITLLYVLYLVLIGKDHSIKGFINLLKFRWTLKWYGNILIRVAPAIKITRSCCLQHPFAVCRYCNRVFCMHCYKNYLDMSLWVWPFLDEYQCPSKTNIITPCIGKY